MKVAIIEPVGGHGGMNYYDFSLADGLAAFGADVTIYTCDETIAPHKVKFKVKCFFKKIWGDSPKILRAARFFFYLLRSLLDARVQKNEMVHYHFFHFTSIELLSVALCRMMGFKITITAHDIKSFSGIYSPSTAKNIIAMADAVITHNLVSKRELLAQIAIPDKKIIVIPHGNYLNTLPAHKPTQREARSNLNLAIENPVLLFFGQVKEVKGLDILLQALSIALTEFPNLKLIVAGKLWKEDFSKYKKIIKNNNLENYVDLHIKYIPDNKVNIFFSSADLIVLPYKKIYQSGVLLMAMSYGLPTLSSDLDGITEIVQDGINGFLFRQGDVEDLGNKIIYVLENREHAKQVARAGYEAMQVYFDWHDIGKRTLELYKSVQ